MGVLIFLIPLFLGIALVTDFRGISRSFMTPSNEASGKGIRLLTGWVFIVLPGAVFVSVLIKALTG